MNEEAASQIYDLQKEWRAIVLSKLTTLEKTQVDLRDDIANMRTTFANQAELAALKVKVEKLENFRAKAVGIFLAVQAMVGILVYLLDKH